MLPQVFYPIDRRQNSCQVVETFAEMLRGMSRRATGPVNKNNIHGFLGIGLDSVNEKLMANPYTRDYTMALAYHLESSLTPQTPLFPHPMYPPEFWRTWAISKGQIYMLTNNNFADMDARDPRSLLKNANYWKCEAVFWFSKLRSDPSELDSW